MVWCISDDTKVNGVDTMLSYMVWCYHVKRPYNEGEGNWRKKDVHFYNQCDSRMIIHIMCDILNGT